MMRFNFSVYFKPTQALYFNVTPQTVEDLVIDALETEEDEFIANAVNKANCDNLEEIIEYLEGVDSTTFVDLAEIDYDNIVFSDFESDYLLEYRIPVYIDEDYILELLEEDY